MSSEPRELVFYLLESEDSPIDAGTQRLVARHLVGHHSDFWADVEPYLTVRVVDDFMREADRVEGELVDRAKRSELERVRRWVRRRGLPVVGYQLE